jgi:hypothetical protein
MKRLALAAAALAALAPLTSCSGDSDSDDAAPEPSTSASESAADEPTEEPTDEATDEATDAPSDDGGDAQRFATTYAQVSTLFTTLNSQESEADPTNAEEANAAAGLDETTPLMFADFSVLPDDTGGSLCLESDTGTYVAVTSAGSEGEIDLGDGECSYETSDAVVVGDVATDTWTTGAEYMGDLVPTGVFGS